MPKLRFALLLTAFCLALSLSCAALSSPWPQAVETGAETALVTESADEPSGEAVPLYELRSVDGEICVFRCGSLLTHTGVLVSSLPQEDRALLEAGIAAESDQELASLIEDLCS
ncbi:MAG: hypothetical protein LUD84_11785 [Clostridiales bacterium]|nr:hypothetical protein [Clostridiales bacterium]